MSHTVVCFVLRFAFGFKGAHLIRSPRRAAENNPPTITAGMALFFETADSWPRGERWRFWNGPDVPARLTELRQPDPRKVLAGDEGRLEFDRDMAIWNAARFAWLKKRVANG